MNLQVIGWFLQPDKINGLQRNSVARILPRLKQAHYTNLRVRINGQWEEVEADWLKHTAPVYGDVPLAEQIRALEARSTANENPAYAAAIDTLKQLAGLTTHNQP